MELLAHHYFEAASLGVADKAIRYATAAAEAAHRRGAFGDEVALLARSLEAAELDADPDPARQGEILATLAIAEHYNGNPERGRELALTAAEVARRAASASLLARAGIAYQGLATQFARPSDSVAVEIMREGLAGLPDEEIALRAQVTASLSYALIFAPGDEAHRLAVEAVELARAAGDDVALAEGLSARAWTERQVVGIEGNRETVTELLQGDGSTRVDSTAVAIGPVPAIAAAANAASATGGVIDETTPK